MRLQSMSFAAILLVCAGLILPAVVLAQHAVADAVAVAAVDPTQYPASTSLFGGKITLYWKLDTSKQIVNMALVATSQIQGWVAIGIGFEGNGMLNADTILISADNSGAVYAVDAWMSGEGIVPTIDASSGGKNDVTLVQGSTYSASQGYSVAFSRPIAATDASLDKAIPTTGYTPISFAYANSMDITQQHCSNCYGMSAIDFSKGGTAAPVDKSLFPFSPIVAAALLVGISLLALPITYIPIFHNTRLGHLIFHRQVLGILPNIAKVHRSAKSKHKKRFIRALMFILAPFYTLAEMSFAELSIVFAFMAACAVWAAKVGADATLNGDTFPVGRAFGAIGQLVLAALLVPVARNSIWTVIFGQSFERSIKLHRLLAVLFWVSITVHGLIMIISYGVASSLGAQYVFSATLSGDGTEPTFVLGGPIAWLLFSIMIFCALFRRFYMWQLFKLSHYVFGIPAVVFAVLHAQSLVWIPFFYAALLLWVIDRILRATWMAIPCKVVSINMDQNSRIIRLEIERPLMWLARPGSFAYVWAPQASVIRRIPLTISSVVPGHKSRFTFHVKLTKQWSFSAQLGKLAAKVAAGQMAPEKTFLRIEGPYGHTRLNPKHYRTIVLIAGGIGATPMISLLQYCTKLIKEGKAGKLQRIIFSWTVGHRSVVKAFDDIISQAIADAGQHLELQFFISHPQPPVQQTHAVELVEPPIKDTTPGVEPVPGQDPAAAPDAQQPAAAVDVQPVVAQDHLEQYCHYGQKAFYPELLKGIREQEQNNNSHTHVVGVFCCGPASMSSEVARCCWKFSSLGSVCFNLHRETFEL